MKYVILFRAYEHWLVWSDANDKQEFSKREAEENVAWIQQELSKSKVDLRIVRLPKEK